MMYAFNQKEKFIVYSFTDWDGLPHLNPAITVQFHGFTPLSIKVDYEVIIGDDLRGFLDVNPKFSHQDTQKNYHPLCLCIEE